MLNAAQVATLRKDATPQDNEPFAIAHRNHGLVLFLDVCSVTGIAESCGAWQLRYHEVILAKDGVPTARLVIAGWVNARVVLLNPREVIQVLPVITFIAIVNCFCVRLPIVGQR